jgi:MFS family permease
MNDRPRAPILVVCCLAQCVSMLDVSIVNVALDSIRADLRFSTSGLQWVLNAYTLTSAGFLLLGGRAADLLGRREVFVGGLAVFGMASLAGGLATEPAMLIAARAGQGLGSAVMAPTSLSILASVYAEGPLRNRAFGLWGTLGGLGGASGALVGGAITDALSWRWILLVNAPIAAAMAVTSLRVIPALRKRPGSFDLAGALTVTAGLVLIACGAVTSHRRGWDSAPTLGPLAAGAALLGVFAVIEARLAAAPLVPPLILRSRALAGAAIVGFCLGGTALSMWFLVSLYVQQGLGFSPLQAGLTLAPMSLTIVIFTQAASRLAARLGPGRVLAAGMTLLGAGMLLFSGSDARGAWATEVLVPSLLCASGIGCSFVSTTITANHGVRKADSGLASGVVTTAFATGGSIGLALLATDDLQRGFAAGGGLALVGAAVALAVLVSPAEPSLSPRWPGRTTRSPARRPSRRAGCRTW